MNSTRTDAAIRLITLSILTGLAVACNKSTPDAPTPPQLQATINGDQTGGVQVDQTTGILTVTPSMFMAGRDRPIQAVIKCQAPANTILAPLNSVLTTTQVDVNQELITINLATYDNASPLRVALIQKDQFRSIQKQYQVQLKAAGPVRFEAFPAGKDTVKLGSFTNQLDVRLPVSNLYTGHPGSNKIRAISVKDKSSVALQERTNDSSEDYLSVMLYPLLSLPKPALYTLEVQTADGQTFVPPVVISIAN